MYSPDDKQHIRKLKREAAYKEFLPKKIFTALSATHGMITARQQDMLKTRSGMSGFLKLKMILNY